MHALRILQLFEYCIAASIQKPFSSSIVEYIHVYTVAGSGSLIFHSFVQLTVSSNG